MKEEPSIVPSNFYFTKVHQDAIVDYVLSEDNKVREKLYKELIGPTFDELINKIVFTYKFIALPNIEELKSECKVYLISILGKFDAEKGTKAFAYFTVCTKHWFMAARREVQKQKRREVKYVDITAAPTDADQQYENPSHSSISRNLHEYEQLITTNNYLTDREHSEHWNLLIKEIEGWQDMPNLKEQEKKVIKAALIIFDTIEEIQPITKKVVYQYMRELTGLNTKQIVNNLNKMRKRYFKFKNNWVNGNI